MRFLSKLAIRTESSSDRQRRGFLRLVAETQLIDGLHTEHVRLTGFKAMNNKPETQAALLGYNIKAPSQKRKWEVSGFEFYLQHFKTFYLLHLHTLHILLKDHICV